MTPEERRLDLRRRQLAARLGLADNPGGVSTNSEAVGEFKSKADSAFHGAMNPFGLSDTMRGVGGAITGVSMQPDGSMETDYSGSMADRYARERDKRREQLSSAKESNPSSFGGGQMLGTGALATISAPIATGRTLLGTVGRGGVLGAIEGAIDGAGNADGRNVAGQSLKHALIGAGIGAAVPTTVSGVGAVKNSIKDPITGMLNVANKSKANRALASAVKSSGSTQDDIVKMLTRAGKEGQPEYRVMDALGVAGQRQASGVARQGGDAATELAEFLEKRQLGQGERVGGFIDDAFGTRGTTAAKTKAALTGARKDAADIAYDAARGNAAPVDVRGALGVIDDRIGGMEGSGIVGDSIDGKLAGYRARLAGSGAGLGDDVSKAELSNFDRVLGVKQSIQDDIGTAVRAGRNNEARELGKLMNELDGALEQSSDMYRAANDGFRSASKVIDSVDEGAQMSARGRAADNVPAFQGMNPEMQGAARVGYGDDLLNKLERVTAPTSNRAKPLQSFKREAETQAMAIDPALMRNRLARENDMWNTQNRALGGSRTADNIADQEAVGELAGGAIGAAKSAANLQFGDVVAKIANAIGPVAKGQNEATRKLIVQALMSSDPAKALAPALRQSGRSDATRRMIEALLRQPAREGANQLVQ